MRWSLISRNSTHCLCKDSPETGVLEPVLLSRNQYLFKTLRGVSMYHLERLSTSLWLFLAFFTLGFWVLVTSSVSEIFAQFTFEAVSRRAVQRMDCRSHQQALVLDHPYLVPFLVPFETILSHCRLARSPLTVP